MSDDGVWVSRRVFCDPALHELEQRRVFGRSWLFLGHESQVAAPGDFFLTRMGEESVILARDARGPSAPSSTRAGTAACASAARTRGTRAPSRAPTTAGATARTAASPPCRTASGRSRTGSTARRSGSFAVPRVESHRGLVFGSFDPGIAPLAEHLGGMADVLDVQLDRSAAGTEVLGLQKWSSRRTGRCRPRTRSATSRTAR